MERFEFSSHNEVCKYFLNRPFFKMSNDEILFVHEYATVAIELNLLEMKTWAEMQEDAEEILKRRKDVDVWLNVLAKEALDGLEYYIYYDAQIEALRRIQSIFNRYFEAKEILSRGLKIERELKNLSPRQLDSLLNEHLDAGDYKTCKEIAREIK